MYAALLALLLLGTGPRQLQAQGRDAADVESGMAMGFGPDNGNITTLGNVATTLSTTAGLGARPNTTRSIVLKGVGSTALQPLVVRALQLAGAEGRAEQQDFDIVYDALGTGTGQSLFVSGSPDALYLIEDTPLSSSALQRANMSVVQVPIAVFAAGFYANLPGTPPLKLGACTLACIYSGSIRRWDDPAIEVLNQGVSLPSEPIKVLARGDASGTTALVTAYLRKACPEQWQQEPGNQAAWAPNVTKVNTTVNMISAINSTAYSLGYAPAPAPEPLPGMQVAVQNSAGGFVAAQLGLNASDALLAANLSAAGALYPPLSASEQAALWSNLTDQMVWGGPASPATAYPMTSLAFIAAPQDARPLGPLGPLIKELVGFMIRGTMQLEVERRALAFQRLPGGLVGTAHAVHDTMMAQPGQAGFALPTRRMLLCSRDGAGGAACSRSLRRCT